MKTYNENPISNWLSKTKYVPVEITYRCLDGTINNPPCVEIKMKLNSTQYDIGNHGDHIILHGCEHYVISSIPYSELNDAYIAERLDKMYRNIAKYFKKYV